MLNLKLVVPTVAIGALALSALAVRGGLASGPKVGDTVTAFEPTHVTGADAGTKTCPVCKYGRIPAVQVWVNGDSTSNVAAIAKDLDKTVAEKGTDNFKAFVVFVQPKGTSDQAMETKLKAVASKASLKNVALTYIPASNDALQDYKINTDSGVKNTVIVYSKMKVVNTFVNLKSSHQGLEALNQATANAVAMIQN